MFLIGQYDSPFVRRTAIALRLYGLPFEHRPWSTFGDADKIATYNPLLRVPVLVLDDGEALIDSAAILDHLDETVGPERAMLAPHGPLRRKQLHTIALATGLGELRNALVVRASDAAIAIGGSWGTLSEVALARRGGLPVVWVAGWEVQGGDGVVAAATPEEGLELLFAQLEAAG